MTFEGDLVGDADDPYLAVLEDEALQELAEVSGGRYDRATDRGTLEQIFAELSRLEHAPLEPRTVSTRRFYSHWFAFAGALLFALGLVADGIWLRRPIR